MVEMAEAAACQHGQPVFEVFFEELPARIENSTTPDKTNLPNIQKYKIEITSIFVFLNNY